MDKKNISKPEEKKPTNRSYYAAQKSSSHIGKIVDTISYPFYMMSLDYRIIASNAAARKEGITPGAYCYKATHGIDEPCSENHICPLKKVVSSKDPVNVEHIHYDKNGGRRFVEIYAAPMFNKNGDVVNVLESAIDITKRKEAELAIKTIFKGLSDSTGKNFFDSLALVLYEWINIDYVLIGECIDANKIESLTVMRKGEIVDSYNGSIVGTPCLEISKKKFTFYPKGVGKLFPKTKKIIGFNPESCFGISVSNKDNEHIGFIIVFSSKRLKLPPQVPEVFRIISARVMNEIERKKYEDQLAEQAIRDELTGLRNRRGFFMLAEHHLKIMKRNKNKAAIFFIDLNNMKKINDSKGHAVGDKALIEVSKFLKKMFRESDVIARIGGDEFAILAAKVNKKNAELLKERMQTQLKLLNKRRKSPYVISLSIGISYYNPSVKKCLIDDLLNKADKAMYIEKVKYRNNHRARP